MRWMLQVCQPQQYCWWRPSEYVDPALFASIYQHEYFDPALFGHFGHMHGPETICISEKRAPNLEIMIGVKSIDKIASNRRLLLKHKILNDYR